MAGAATPAQFVSLSLLSTICLAVEKLAVGRGASVGWIVGGAILVVVASALVALFFIYYKKKRGQISFLHLPLESDEQPLIGEEEEESTAHVFDPKDLGTRRVFAFYEETIVTVDKPVIVEVDSEERNDDTKKIGDVKKLEAPPIRPALKY